MASHTSSDSRWDQRITRARELRVEYPSASEALTFYAALAEYQRTLFLGASPRAASEFSERVDIDSASAAVPDFLSWLEHTGPAPLTRLVPHIRGKRTDWRRLMHDSLRRPHERPVLDDRAGPEADATMFVVEAVLQPYAEAAALVRHEAIDQRSHGSDVPAPQCPVCSSHPCVGILREEGQGAKRTLLCVRCATEWTFPRVVCPSCREEQFDALPVYTADACPSARIDACDTCRTYLKTIDLTRNGLAVPVVDDIATVALDLWARQQGYRRLRENLLRTSEAGPPTALGI